MYDNVHDSDHVHDDSDVDDDYNACGDDNGPMSFQEPDIFVRSHQFLGTTKNRSALRLLYYPPLPEKSLIKAGQVRCGEHSDYGSITLLFQDHIGGLEVRWFACRTS